MTQTENPSVNKSDQVRKDVLDLNLSSVYVQLLLAV